MNLAFEGIWCHLGVLLGLYWGAGFSLGSPSLSFLLQNLKVPVPDEISLELGRVLCLCEAGLIQGNDFIEVIYARWGLFPGE